MRFLSRPSQIWLASFCSPKDSDELKSPVSDQTVCLSVSDEDNFQQAVKNTIAKRQKERKIRRFIQFFFIIFLRKEIKISAILAFLNKKAIKKDS